MSGVIGLRLLNSQIATMNINNYDTPLCILSVDDDEDDYIIMRDLLSDMKYSAVQVEWISNYDKALKTLLKNEHDLCLLDFYLGEHNGLELMREAQQAGCQIPFVMLTVSNDRSIDLEAMQSGAEYYLVKKNITPHELERAVRYSLERARLLRTTRELNEKLEERVAERTRMLEEANQLLEAEMAEREKVEKELRILRHERQRQALDQIAQNSKTTVTAQLLGIHSLRETEPHMFESLVENYSTLIDLALEQQAYKVEHNISQQLRELAERMGTLRLSPRDVVEVHNLVLGSRNKGMTQAKAESYIEEGRLLILELMGYMVSYYRNFAYGGRLLSKDDR